jgi:hypothetical protein
VGGDAALAKRPGHLFRDVFVLQRGQGVERLDQCHLGAERPVQGGELQPDGAGPDHHHGAGDAIEVQGLVAGDDSLPQLHAGEELGLGSGGQDDALRLEGPPVDLDGPLPGQLRPSLDDLDLPRLDQRGQPGDELVDDLLLELLDLGPVRLAGGGDAPLRRPVDLVHHRGGLEEGLGGDASSEEARAPQPPVPLDQSHPLVQRCGPECRGVATGAGPDHDDVERIGHARPFVGGRTSTVSHTTATTVTSEMPWTSA